MAIISAIYGDRERLKFPQNRSDLGIVSNSNRFVKKKYNFGNLPIPSKWISDNAETRLFGGGTKNCARERNLIHTAYADFRVIENPCARYDLDKKALRPPNKWFRTTY